MGEDYFNNGILFLLNCFTTTNRFQGTSMARIIIVLSLLMLSLTSFSMDRDYDPFSLEITVATAVKQGTLCYDNNVILYFNRLQNTTINSKLESAKENNKKLVIGSISLDDEQRQRATLSLSENEPDDEWETLAFKDIKLKKGAYFSHSSLSYKIDDKIENFCIYQKDIEKYLEHIIQLSKLRKVKISINISALRSENKQKYLRGKQIAYTVGSNHSL